MHLRREQGYLCNTTGKEPVFMLLSPGTWDYVDKNLHEILFKKVKKYFWGTGKSTSPEMKKEKPDPSRGVRFFQEKREKR
jgi:hypothetical protein